MKKIMAVLSVATFLITTALFTAPALATYTYTQPDKSEDHSKWLWDFKDGIDFDDAFDKPEYGQERRQRQNRWGQKLLGKKWSHHDRQDKSAGNESNDDYGKGNKYGDDENNDQWQPKQPRWQDHYDDDQEINDLWESKDRKWAYNKKKFTAIAHHRYHKGWHKRFKAWKKHWKKHGWDPKDHGGYPKKPSPVPLPASSLLFFSGLGVLAIARNRKQAR